MNVNFQTAAMTEETSRTRGTMGPGAAGKVGTSVTTSPSPCTQPGASKVVSS